MNERFALMLDGAGGAVSVDLDGPIPAPAEGGFLWVHVMQAAGTSAEWLAALGGDGLVEAALMAEETRPRCTVLDETVLMNLRGVNLNPGAQPEDMVSMRIWAGARQIVTVTRRQVQALGDLRTRSEAGKAPASPAELIARLALRLADRAEPVVAELNERIDDLEEQVAAGHTMPLRTALADIRRVSIVLRRYMFPQRDALSTLEIEELPWIGRAERSSLREATERVTRLAEELDAIRDRAQVVHDHMMDARAEQMNRQMLLLSVVAAIFLPLGLITGLLGINVGGMPGATSPHAFWIVSGGLLAVGALLLFLFARLGWLRSR
ncbi:zinc transporter ZntB [Roseovarius pelagicus]|uniref:Zinc transporter ZntB n=1 Tax=Roseovarius pelagicus TaxID=2980108 RepID=A0ABY6DCI4_9RHOB|nr:zinc transporter ZntB [Roseovarius pelagicus]UXX82723.1 zinc transporter ZntB [Roseovarius pelagicus]